MELLKNIIKVTIHKLPLDENAIVDAIYKLAKETTCLDNKPISIEVYDHQVLLDVKLIERNNLKSVVSSIDKDQELYWR